MRQLKFRVWSIYSEKMFDNGFYLHANGDLFEDDELDYKNRDAYKIMQYTGLKDKNGKEIYEGDILKVPDLYETPENTYPTYHHEKVIYANHGFGTENAMFYEDGDYISEECEVIGNIFENPELLQ